MSDLTLDGSTRSPASPSLRQYRESAFPLSQTADGVGDLDGNCFTGRNCHSS